MSAAEETAVRQLRADARRNRERILEAAKQVFGEQGADAQMDDVARRAGVGVGTVYRHFPNKDVLMGELVTEKFRSFTEHARESLDEDDAWEGFSELLYATAENMAENVALQDALRTTSAAFEYAEPARLELDKVIEQAHQARSAPGNAAQGLQGRGARNADGRAVCIDERALSGAARLAPPSADRARWSSSPAGRPFQAGFLTRAGSNSLLPSGLQGRELDSAKAVQA